MSTEINSKLDEVQLYLDRGLTAVALQQLIIAGRLMDEQAGHLKDALALQNQTIQEMSERLKVVEELRGEIECGEVEQI